MAEHVCSALTPATARRAAEQFSTQAAVRSMHLCMGSSSTPCYGMRSVALTLALRAAHYPRARSQASTSHPRIYKRSALSALGNKQSQPKVIEGRLGLGHARGSAPNKYASRPMHGPMARLKKVRGACACVGVWVGGCSGNYGFQKTATASTTPTCSISKNPKGHVSAVQCIPGQPLSQLIYYYK